MYTRRKVSPGESPDLIVSVLASHWFIGLMSTIALVIFYFPATSLRAKSANAGIAAYRGSRILARVITPSAIA